MGSGRKTTFVAATALAMMGAAGGSNHDDRVYEHIELMGENPTQPERIVLEPPGGVPGVRRSSQPRGSNRKRTPTVEQMYGELERAGHVRIIRKKGRAPKIVWLKS